MAFNRFSLALIVRVSLLTIVLIGLSVALSRTGYYSITIVLGAIGVGLVLELYRYVSKTNAELVRFLEAARHEDFAQRFAPVSSGAGFEQLTAVFGDIMRGFHASRREQEEQLRHLKSLTEHIPVPLLSLFPDGRIRLHNNAARRLFSEVKIANVEDLKFFGADFYTAILEIEPGQRKLLNFSYDGMQRQLTAVMTRIVTGSISEKLISMQDIQSELDDVQLHAWQDLVRVLTHEIMNSITPVASLAKTATDLADDIHANTNDATAFDEIRGDFQDLRHAVDTVGRRSNGLMQFVQSYRSLTKMPTPRKQTLVLAESIARATDLFAENWKTSGIDLQVKLEPASLTIQADPDLLEQLLINLLQNAEQALGERDSPRIEMHARLNQRGHVLLELADNGPGISGDIVDKIFVPFFTTKPGGSGVGLALTRQIMIAHGGSVTVRTSDAGGAKFVLIF